MPMHSIMRNILTLLLVAVILVSCQTKKPEIGPPQIPVYTTKPEVVSVYKDFVGQTFGLFDISIRARVDGYLEGIHFEEGGRVNKGQLLYSIDPAPLNAKVAEALSIVAQAKTNLIKAESDYKRYKPLAENNAVSQSDYDASLANYGAAQAALKASEASLEYAKIQKSYTNIYAPISGIIGRSEAKVGDYVGREPNPVVLNTISRLDTILVQFHLTELQYLNLAKFEKAKKTIANPNEEKLAEVELYFANGSQHSELGKIDFIGRSIDPTTGTLMVQASFPNPNELVRPGQFARLRISVNDANNAILIPLKCLQEVQGQFNVFVVNTKGEVEFRTIKIGETLQDMVIVESGLKANEQIVLEGMNRVRSGMKVIPEKKEFKSVRNNKQ